MQPLSDETTEYQNLAKLNEQFQTKNLILPNGQYFAGDLEKSLEEVEKISYYEKSAKTILNDDVTIELYSDAKRKLYGFNGKRDTYLDSFFRI